MIIKSIEKEMEVKGKRWKTENILTGSEEKRKRIRIRNRRRTGSRTIKN